MISPCKGDLVGIGLDILQHLEHLTANKHIEYLPFTRRNLGTIVHMRPRLIKEIYRFFTLSRHPTQQGMHQKHFNIGGIGIELGIGNGLEDFDGRIQAAEVVVANGDEAEDVEEEVLREGLRHEGREGVFVLVRAPLEGVVSLGEETQGALENVFSEQALSKLGQNDGELVPLHVVAVGAQLVQTGLELVQVLLGLGTREEEEGQQIVEELGHVARNEGLLQTREEGLEVDQVGFDQELALVGRELQEVDQRLEARESELEDQDVLGTQVPADDELVDRVGEPQVPLLDVKRVEQGLVDVHVLQLHQIRQVRVHPRVLQNKLLVFENLFEQLRVQLRALGVEVLQNEHSQDQACKLGVPVGHELEEGLQVHFVPEALEQHHYQFVVMDAGPVLPDDTFQKPVKFLDRKTLFLDGRSAVAQGSLGSGETLRTLRIPSFG